MCPCKFNKNKKVFEINTKNIKIGVFKKVTHAFSASFQFSIEDPDSSIIYEFDAGVWVKMDAFNDFWRELPVKKLIDQLPGESIVFYVTVTKNIFFLMITNVSANYIYGAVQ